MAFGIVNTINAAKTDLSNVDSSVFANKIASAGGGTPIVTATSTDGVAYTATIYGMAELTVGKPFIIIPNVMSTVTTPTLNVNGLGAKSILQGLSTSTGSTVEGSSATWLSANKPIEIMWDGAVFRANITRPAAGDLNGILPVSNGGTGYRTIADSVYATPRYRASALVSTETVPTTNGVINWMYE